jgi:plasmid stabilization system protein ParE
MADVLITQGAEDDYTQLFLWYAERSQQVASSFEAEYEKALESIGANPDYYPLCDDRHRFYLLKRFPFQVIYRKISEDRWLVVAVAHASRHPGYWTER